MFSISKLKLDTVEWEEAWNGEGVSLLCNSRAGDFLLYLCENLSKPAYSPVAINDHRDQDFYLLSHMYFHENCGSHDLAACFW